MCDFCGEHSTKCLEVLGKGGGFIRFCGSCWNKTFPAILQFRPCKGGMKTNLRVV